jgi:hypothetical protein
LSQPETPAPTSSIRVACNGQLRLSQKRGGKSIGRWY